MLIDVTGVLLTPGNHGEDCLGNGEHMDENGKCIECCCDECDYYLDCFPLDGIPFYRNWNPEKDALLLSNREMDCQRLD